MIDEVLRNLQDKWGWTVEQLDSIRFELANYAMAAQMDSHVRREAADICEQYVSGRDTPMSARGVELC